MQSRQFKALILLVKNYERIKIIFTIIKDINWLSGGSNMKKILNVYDELGWKEAKGYPKGTRIKTLRDEGNAKTIWLKLPKGFYMDSHSHVTTEQHFVIEGEYKSDGKIYQSGTYQLIPAGVDHGPFESKNGAIVLVVWDPFKN